MARLVTELPMKLTRAEIKAAGGPAYEAQLVYERAARAKFRKRHPSYWAYDKSGIPFKTALCANARFRGRKRGLIATIRPEDLIWPTHCPVLGLELDYPERSGMRGESPAQSNWPSLDRWDSARGYVPGNVFVISLRANTLKNNATHDEILKIAAYLAHHPSDIGHG